MNRDQAIRAVADKIGLSGPFTTNLVDAMAAVGVLKLQEEPASAASKWKVGDIVTLASGGPRMTVVQICTGTHFQVTVEWYGADGAKCNDRLPQDALVAVGVMPESSIRMQKVALVCTATGAGKQDGQCTYVRVDVMVEALRMAGYEVRKR